MGGDGIKFTIASTAAACRLLKHLGISFSRLVNDETGEVTNSGEKLKKNHLTYTQLPSGAVVIQGNLYEFYSGLSNLADFSFDDMVAALNHFCAYHAVEAKDIVVNKLEVGFNIPCSPRTPEDILRDIVTCRYRMKEVSTYRSKGLSNAFVFDDYKVLFYDKGKKHRLNQDLFRVELVANQGLLRRKGISTVADLYDRENMSALYQHLRGCIEATVFTDSQMDTTKLSARELRLFQDYRADWQWQELNKYSSENSRKVKKRYQELIAKHGSNNTQQWLLDSLDEACKEHGLVNIGKNYRFSAVDKKRKSGVLTS